MRPSSRCGFSIAAIHLGMSAFVACVPSTKLQAVGCAGWALPCMSWPMPRRPAPLNHDGHRRRQQEVLRAVVALCREDAQVLGVTVAGSYARS